MRSKDGLLLVSVIISVRQDRRIQSCLDSIFQGGAEGLGGDYEVIVVENASLPSLGDIIRQYSVIYLVEPVPGMGYARARALERAAGDVIVFTDADCVVSRGWLANIVKPLADARVGIVGGPVQKHRPQTYVERHQRDLVAGGQQQVQYLKPIYPRPYVVTANAAYRASAVHAAGGIDPQFFSGGDVDLAWRIGDLGYSAVISSEAVVYHACRESHRKVFRQFYTYSLGHALLFRKFRKSTGKVVCVNLYPFAGIASTVLPLALNLLASPFSARRRARVAELSFRLIEHFALIAGAIVGSIRFRVAYI
jgi:GT2 family glycosyltransferase